MALLTIVLFAGCINAEPDPIVFRENSRNSQEFFTAVEACIRYFPDVVATGKALVAAGATLRERDEWREASEEFIVEKYAFGKKNPEANAIEAINTIVVSDTIMIAEGPGVFFSSLVRGCSVTIELSDPEAVVEIAESWLLSIIPEGATVSYGSYPTNPGSSRYFGSFMRDSEKVDFNFSLPELQYFDHQNYCGAAPRCRVWQPASFELEISTDLP
jgi:hypothetical protein